MVFGTPGGDQQDQWTLQFFLNFVDFDMNLQEAIDSPTFHSLHFPSSFYPHERGPRRGRRGAHPPATRRKELEARGHRITPPATGPTARSWPCASIAKNGVISGAVSPRRGSVT